MLIKGRWYVTILMAFDVPTNIRLLITNFFVNETAKAQQSSVDISRGGDFFTGCCLHSN